MTAAMSARVPRLPPLPHIRDILKIYKLTAVKRLSQNFLLDSYITNKIVNVAGGKRASVEGAYVCEVGPGPGTITRCIIAKGAKHLTVVEKDQRFLPSLQMLSNACGGSMTVHLGDILHFNMSRLFPEEAAVPWDGPTPPIYIIGNLPFNVSTPLITKWLRYVSERSDVWRYGRVEMVLTFQKEVGERMVAEVNDRQRTRLSIMCQYLCHVTKRFVIKGKAFVPPPEVDAAVMRFIPRKEPLIDAPYEHVEKLVRHVFHSRQKHCKHGLQRLFPPDRPELTVRLLTEAHVNPEARSFELEMMDFQRLCVVYKRICDEHDGLLEYDYRSQENAPNWRRPSDVPSLDFGDSETSTEE